MEFFEDLINNSTFYYCLVGIVYVLCIVFVVMLLVKNKRKKHVEVKTEVKNDLDTVDLESVLEKMQEEANKQKDQIMTFEEEQEEKAIISYQELLNAVKKNVNEVTKPKESLEEQIERREIKSDLENSIESIVLKDTKDIVDKNPQETKSSKFQNSEFISPIYGRVNNDVEYPKIKAFNDKDKEDDLEKTMVMPKLDSKIDSNDEFLRILKEFRNNLE